MIKTILLCVSLLTVFVSCHSNERDAWLKEFDNSLDSLITEPVYHSRPFTILIGDTLHGNPVEVRDTCYAFYGTGDPVLIEANCHIYKFRNNQVVEDLTDSGTGGFRARFYVHFDHQINDNTLDSLQKVYAGTDTLVSGVLRYFDKKGNIIKEIYAHENDYRILRMYRYDEQGREAEWWMREYHGKKYDPDSLRNALTKHSVNTYVEGYEYPAYKYYENGVLVNTVEARTPSRSHSYQESQEDGSTIMRTMVQLPPILTFDTHGNWIKKEDIIQDGIGSVFYRTILYE